jgi:hypothetical protein
MLLLEAQDALLQQFRRLVVNPLDRSFALQASSATPLECGAPTPQRAITHSIKQTSIFSGLIPAQVVRHSVKFHVRTTMTHCFHPETMGLKADKFAATLLGHFSCYATRSFDFFRV